MRLEGALRGIRSLLLPENRDGERALHENIFENQGGREGGRGDWGIQRHKVSRPCNIARTVLSLLSKNVKIGCVIPCFSFLSSSRNLGFAFQLRTLQRGTKRYANLATQDPGKARQSS